VFSFEAATGQKTREVLFSQGDQIGRIFAQNILAYWAAVFFGQFFSKNRKLPNFFNGVKM
jgi:hypothetical protein